MTNQITITQTKANEEEVTTLQYVKITKISVETPVYEPYNYMYIKFTFDNSIFMIKQVYEEAHEMTLQFYEGNNMIKSITYEPPESPTQYIVEITDNNVEVTYYDWNGPKKTTFMLSKEIAGKIINIAVFGTRYYYDTPLRATIYYEEYIPPPPPPPSPVDVAVQVALASAVLSVTALTISKIVKDIKSGMSKYMW